MALTGVAAKVSALIKKPVEDMGLTLWDVRFVKEGASYYLRVYIDKVDGVGINDCTDVSRMIDPIIDEADPIDKAYYMEVCSPGLERDLVQKEHFLFAVGKPVKLRLYKAKDGKKDYAGVLLSYDDEAVLDCGGKTEVFAKNEIASAKLDDLSL